MQYGKLTKIDANNAYVISKGYSNWQLTSTLNLKKTDANTVWQKLGFKGDFKNANTFRGPNSKNYLLFPSEEDAKKFLKFVGYDINGAEYSIAKKRLSHNYDVIKINKVGDFDCFILSEYLGTVADSTKKKVGLGVVNGEYVPEVADEVYNQFIDDLKANGIAVGNILYQSYKYVYNYEDVEIRANIYTPFKNGFVASILYYYPAEHKLKLDDITNKYTTDFFIDLTTTPKVKDNISIILQSIDGVNSFIKELRETSTLPINIDATTYDTPFSPNLEVGNFRFYSEELESALWIHKGLSEFKIFGDDCIVIHLPSRTYVGNALFINYALTKLGIPVETQIEFTEKIIKSDITDNSFRDELKDYLLSQSPAINKSYDSDGVKKLKELTDLSVSSINIILDYLNAIVEQD